MASATLADRLARFNRRLPNKVIGTVAGRRLSPVALVVHQGRRSGRQYRTPVMPLRLDDGFLVSLPYGPGRDWVANVLAAGRCTPQRGGRRFALADTRACWTPPGPPRCCRRPCGRRCAWSPASTSCACPGPGDTEAVPWPPAGDDDGGPHPRGAGHARGQPGLQRLRGT